MRYNNNSGPPELHLLRAVPDASKDTQQMYRSTNTARSNAASYSKPGGQLSWLCPDVIAQLYVEGQNRLPDYYSLGAHWMDSPAQHALGCECRL
jgi:hypothetical protein